jgi:hypothetical protein
MRIDLPHLSPERDRHGNMRLYVRRFGRRIRIHEDAGTPEFLAAYTSALTSLGTPAAPASTIVQRASFPKGTLGWLGVQYFDSDEFKALNAKSQANRRGIIESCFDVPYTDEDPTAMGFCPLNRLTAQGVKRMRDHAPRSTGSAGGKGARNNRKKYLSAMFGWAVEQTPPLMKANPARDVKRVAYATDGFHTWTLDEVRRYAQRHPVGTKAFLALALLMFLGVRRSDVVKAGTAASPYRALHDGRAANPR